MLVVECGSDHDAERRYAIDVTLGEFLGLEYEIASRDGLRDVVISSRDPGDERRLVVADVLFAEHDNVLVEATVPQAPLATSDLSAFADTLTSEDVPLLYARPLRGGAHVSVELDRVELGIDIFGGVFTMLTRLEEVVSNERDAHGRFPATAALAVRSGFSQRPLVDEYVEVLWWTLRRLWPGLERSARTFSMRPTHDVDWPFYSRGKPFETLRQASSDVFVHRNRSLAVDRLRALATVARSGRAADPCNTFDFLMRTSEAHGLRSAFYFMGGATDPARDANYPFDDWLRRLIREIDGRGHELGLHPSYRTYLDPEAMRRELETLRAVVEAESVEQDVVGGRQHYLRWECPATWRIWAELGLAYDSTLGYAELCGFRCGTCHTFPVFDLEQRRPLELRERPLIAMEAALLTYQRKALAAAVDELRELKAVCRRFEGTFTFLWHNNRLTTPEERAAYAAVLD